MTGRTQHLGQLVPEFDSKPYSIIFCEKPHEWNYGWYVQCHKTATSQAGKANIASTWIPMERQCRGANFHFGSEYELLLPRFNFQSAWKHFLTDEAFDSHAIMAAQL